jgi:hypothetical protein
MLSYATIMTGGNPQTFVWQSPRPEFKPKYNSLEDISRLSWYESRRTYALLNPVDEDTGIRMALRKK